MIEISVLILTKNEAKHVGACLEAIFSQQTSVVFEVILVDSGSTDETLEIARKYPVKIYQIPEETFHHARTRNYAASLAQGKYLVYLAADALPVTTDWLQILISNFSDPSVGSVYGRHLPKPGATAERHVVLGTVYGNERLVKEPSCRRELGYRYYHFSTVNAAIRKSVWQTIPFPEDLRVFEDVGIAKGILDSGWKIVYEPRACVYHSHNHSAKDLFRRYFDSGVVSQRLGLVDKDARASLRREAWRLLRRNLALNSRNGHRGAVWQTMLRNLAKSTGWMLGRKEHYLPLRLKKRFSAFGLFG
jgi:glycosyltransferase involved in cell wall biosynthesis